MSCNSKKLLPNIGDVQAKVFAKSLAQNLNFLAQKESLGTGGTEESFISVESNS